MIVAEVATSLKLWPLGFQLGCLVSVMLAVLEQMDSVLCFLHSLPKHHHQFVGFWVALSLFPQCKEIQVNCRDAMTPIVHDERNDQTQQFSSSCKEVIGPSLTEITLEGATNNN